MKITDIQIRFVPGNRPTVTVKLDAPIPDKETLTFESVHHKESNAWVYRAQDGDFIFGGASLPGQGPAKIRTLDGLHTGLKEMTRSNGPAISVLFPKHNPAMDVMIQEGAGLHYGMVDAIAVAKYIWATQRLIALAIVEWPGGMRVYEPVQIGDDDEPVVNRQGDKIVFLCTPQGYAAPANDPEPAPEADPGDVQKKD